MRVLMLLVLAIGFAADADAQIFGRRVYRQPMVSNCPGGVCPLPQQSRVVTQPVQMEIQYHWQSANRHWTHPGTIQSHMESTHGVDVTGMTGEQALAMHDAIHEGRYVAQGGATPPQTIRVLPPTQPARRSDVVTYSGCPVVTLVKR